MTPTTPDQLRAAFDELCTAGTAHAAATVAYAATYAAFIDSEAAIMRRGLDHLLGGTCDTASSRRDAIQRTATRLAVEDADEQVRAFRVHLDSAQSRYNLRLAALPEVAGEGE